MRGAGVNLFGTFELVRSHALSGLAMGIEGSFPSESISEGRVSGCEVFANTSFHRGPRGQFLFPVWSVQRPDQEKAAGKGRVVAPLWI